MAIGMCIVYHHENEPWTLRAGEFLGPGTNNQAELFAVSRALVLLRRVPSWQDAKVTLFTDSQYAIGVLTKNWAAEKNLDIIALIKGMLVSYPNVSFQHVKGHAGNEGNVIVDRLAGWCRKNTSNWLVHEPVRVGTKLP